MTRDVFEIKASIIEFRRFNKKSLNERRDNIIDHRV